MPPKKKKKPKPKPKLVKKGKRRPAKKPNPEKPRKIHGKKDRLRKKPKKKSGPVKLDGWLGNRPAIRDAIVWETSVKNGAGVPAPYASWTADMKQQLENAYIGAWNGAPTGLVDPPANLLNPGDDEYPTTALAEKQAWSLYVAHVAQSLAVETGKRVAGSLAQLDAEQLGALFDSRAMFNWTREHDGYDFGGGEKRVMPAPPDIAYGFLVGHGLTGPTRLETIANLLGWCRDNLSHFLGAFKAQNVQDHWQYRGVPPVTRILAGTFLTGHPEWGVRHWTAGCRGTLSFLRAMLRTVNIPVLPVYVCGHALVYFPTEKRWLSHGDDPYNALSKATPAFAASNLLTVESSYQSWFGAGVSDQEKCENVGRRTRELALTYLPDYLLQKYCEDVAQNKTHAAGQVYSIFAKDYALGYLENTVKLWTKLDAKIQSMGGCGSI